MTNVVKGVLPPSPPDLAAAAAKGLLADARRGPAMATNVEQRCAGLGRKQLTTVVATLFAELATMYQR
jgi:hypothetical protein